MARNSSSSRFAFILHADVVGSTALVQRDERVAHERIQSAFKGLSRQIVEHGGTTREVRGDALVAEFEKASDAVCAALAFQSDNTVGADSEDDTTPQLRIGIAMGEAVFADRTVTGASVVLAQRLEQLAEPGSVVIQASAQESIPQRLPIDYRFLGEHEVKGFERPVRAFEASLRAGQTLPGSPNKTEPREHPSSLPRRGRIAAAAAGLVLLSVVLLAWWRPWQPEFTPASVERMAHPLPDKPSIAVVPFENIGVQGELAYLIDGLAESVSEELSRLPDLFVISSYSSASFKGRETEIQEIAEALGVRYLLEGTLERSGDDMNLRTRLIDAVSGNQLWQLDLELDWEDVFTVSDRIVDRVASSLSLDSSPERNRHTIDPNAFDLYFRGESLSLRFSRQENEQAREFYIQAIEIDPDFARAHAALALSYFHDVHFRWRPATDATLERARDAAARALSMDDTLPQAHVASGFAWLLENDPAAAIRAAERAVSIDPDHAPAFLLLGMATATAGEYDKAIEALRQAARLNPYPPAIYEMSYGRALLLGGQPEEARIHLTRALEINPTYQAAHVYLVATLESLGEVEEAQLAGARLLSLAPDFKAGSWLAGESSGDRALATIIDAAINRTGRRNESVNTEEDKGQSETTRTREYIDSIRNVLRRAGSGDRPTQVPEHDSGRK